MNPQSDASVSAVNEKSFSPLVRQFLDPLDPTRRTTRGGGWRELRPALQVLFAGDPALHNPYSLVLVNPKRHPGVRAPLARRLSAFLRSREFRQYIARFGADRYGQPLFHVPGTGAGARSDRLAGRALKGPAPSVCLPCQRR